MGTVKGNWLTGAHSGCACRHDDIYTRVDSKTGKCYSAKLCNPSESVSESQITSARTSVQSRQPSLHGSRPRRRQILLITSA